MRFCKYLKVIFIVLLSTSFGKEVSSPSSTAILNHIETHLPHFGILKNLNGFVYVDLEDEYIHQLISFIQEEGFQEPPYFGDSRLVGAHISVIYSAESAKYGMEEIEECGERISFTLQNCQIVHPPSWKEIDEVYLVAVQAPELDAIRKKYGLPKKKHDFHITIGVKPKNFKSA